MMWKVGNDASAYRYIPDDDQARVMAYDPNNPEGRQVRRVPFSKVATLVR